MSEPKVTRYITFEEYLRLEAKSAVRHEYVRGELFAIVGGASEAHNTICSNLHLLLGNYLRGTGCRVLEAQMMVFIETMDSAYYPDIMVTCEPLESKSQFKTGPSLIAEVLSRSTKHIDRREKRTAYRHLDSLQYYLLVEQTRMMIEVNRRISTMEWESVVLRGSDDLRLDFISDKPLIAPVRAVYEYIELPPFVEEEEDEYELV